MLLKREFVKKVHSCRNILEQALMNFVFPELSVDRFLLIGSESFSMRQCLPFMRVYFPLCLHPPARGEACTVPSARNVYPFTHSGPPTHVSFSPESFPDPVNCPVNRSSPLSFRNTAQGPRHVI